MMLNHGRHGSERVLSRPSVETNDPDQLTPDQKARSGSSGATSTIKASVLPLGGDPRDNPCEPIGKYGWDGGLGTSWYSDPHEEMVTILLTSRLDVAGAPDVCLDFWTSAYQPSTTDGPGRGDLSAARHRPRPAVAGPFT